MNNLMIDIESLGTKPGSIIASIGAVFFDPATGDTGPEFETLLSVSKQRDIGFAVDADTQAWWEKQSLEAQAQLQGSQDPFMAADDFLYFVLDHVENRKKVKVWGNGASFDPVLIESFYQKLDELRPIGVKAPWEFWNIRDVRTLVDLGRQIGVDPKKTIPFQGTRHSALADAKHQARYVSHIWQVLTSVKAAA